jgi:glucan 1,3-beta-glucosidase
MHDLLARTKAGNIRLNVIEAFDQPWKRLLEGTVGGHWGFITDPPRRFKFAWGQPVSNHPHWPWQALGGVLFAALVFGAARMAQRRSNAPELDVAAGLTVAAIAAAGGMTLGLTVENAFLESLGWSGVLRSLMLIVIAVGVPLACAAAIGARIKAPAFADLLANASVGTLRRQHPLQLALVVLLMTTTIMSVQAALGFAFNPRYLDFPFAPLTAAVLPYLLLSLLHPTAGAKRPPARAVSEALTAAVIVLSVAYIAWSEGMANWQSLWFCAALLVLAVTLVRAQSVRS